MGKKIDYETAKQRCEELGVKLLCSKDEWKGVLSKIDEKVLYHSYWFLDKNGHEFYRPYNNTVNNKNINCKECAEKIFHSAKAVPFEIALEKVKNKNCELLCTKDEWNKYKTKAKYNFKCSCGKIFKRSYDNVVSKNQIHCEDCSTGISMSYKKACKKVELLGCKLISPKEEWVGVKEKYYFLDEKGHMFFRCFDNVINNKNINCNQCAIEKSADAKRINEDEFNNRKNMIFKKNNLMVITSFNEFQGMDSKVRLICPLCNYEDEAIMDNLFRKNRPCQNCNSSASIGECKVISILKSNGISYKHQAKFEELVYKQDLRVDFFIPAKDNNFKGYVIEVQSNYHKKYNSFLHGSYEQYLEYQERDKIKETYFKTKNIEYTLFYIDESEKSFEDDLNNIIDIILKDKRVCISECNPTHWTEVRARIGNGTPIAMYDAVTGNLIDYFENGAKEAAEKLNIKLGGIRDVLSKKARHYKGLVFKYVDNGYSHQIEPLCKVRIR